MSIRHLMRERRVEIIDGRRFLVYEPTCTTIVKILYLFSQELLILRKEFLTGPALETETWCSVGSRLFNSKPMQATEVLATCCELWEGAPGEIESVMRSRTPESDSGLMIRERLSESVLTLCDVNTIVGLMSWDHIDARIIADGGGDDDADVLDDEVPSGLEIVVTCVASRFGQDPRVVMHWPYEMVTTLYEQLLPATEEHEEARRIQADRLREFGVHGKVR